MAKDGKSKKRKGGKKAKFKPPALTADLTRSERILLLLAWAKAVEAVVIDGTTYRCPDGWVDTWLLAHHSIGGAGATTRLRELRRAPNIHADIERRERMVNGNIVVEVRFARG